MAQGSTTLHEREDKLSPQIIDHHRAIVSLMEELEAVDWYDQRASAATDAGLREILTHNRDEEKEHAMMLLEWLRRNDAKLKEMIETYVGRSGSIVKTEEEVTGGGAGDGGSPSAPAVTERSLGIGSLRGEG